MSNVFNLAHMGYAMVASGLIVGVLQRIAYNNRLAGVQKPVSAPKPVQARRANRMELSAPVIDEDTAELPGLTGRQRWGNGGMDAAVAMRREQRIWHAETGRVNVTADEILTGAGIREIFAEVQAEHAELLPVLAEAREAIFRRMERTGAYPVVASHPDGPMGPSGPAEPVPAVPVLVGQPRVPAVMLQRIHQAAQRALAGA